MRVTVYRERYGSAFPDIGEAMIKAILPLSAELGRWHFGLSSDPPPRRIHPSESRWLEGLCQGKLESTLNQMSKTQRFGALPDELENILIKRVKKSPQLTALFNRINGVQAKWLRATAPIFSARFPQASPDKLILNQFATEWALAVGEELKLRTFLCAEAREHKTQALITDRMRMALIKWALAILNSQWSEALRLIGLIEQQWLLYDLEAESIELPLFLDEVSERYAAGLHQAMKWAILGRWGRAFLVLHQSLFPEGEPEDLEAFINASEHNPLFKHISAAFDSIEQLCSLCEAPIIPEPLIAESVVGQRKWKLEELLGDGLWRAVDQSNMHGCVEEISPLAEGEWSNTTQQEALILSSTQHPHIANIQDWGVDPETGRWFMAYPYVYGESLVDRIERCGPLSEAQARAFFLQMCEALLKAEKQGLLHRQIRPENIIFYSEEQVVLTRWGVHRSGIEGWRASSDHSPWRRMFMPMEVWESAQYSTQSDIYSLGITLAYALNPVAFDWESEWAEIFSYLNQKKSSESQSALTQTPWFKLDDFPKSFHDILTQSTAPNHEDRYPSLFSFSDALQKLKIVYDYRGEFGERENLKLMEAVALIIAKPKSHHRIWQNHLQEWVPWEQVDEIEQVVTAALAQQASEDEKAQAQAQAQEEATNSAHNEIAATKPSTPRSPRRSLVKKRDLNPTDTPVPTHQSRRRSPTINPYLLKGSIAEAPGTIHTITFEGIPLKFCYAPQGDFFMGTHSHAPDVLRIERPQHVVTISRPLLVSQTPITQGLYAALMGINPSYFPNWHAPVEQLSWKEAAEFCNHLSRLDGLEEVYEFKEEVPVIEADDEQVDDEEDGSYFAHIKALRQAKKQQDEQESNSQKIQESESVESTPEQVVNKTDDESVNKTDDQETSESSEPDQDTAELEDETNPQDLVSKDSDELEQLQLSAEVEKDESLDERRRQILNESEKELEEKAKRRYQLEKVKEAPPKKLWVRCRLNSGGYRLPTEAEWEYVARAGTVLVFAGSKVWRDVAWGSPAGQEGTQAVAQLKPNAWGLYDMSGNVAEWCSDGLRHYTRNTVDPCYQLSEEWTLIDTRVIRGGGWKRPEIHARVSARAKCSASQKRSHIGFRVVRPLLPVSPFDSVSSDEDLT